MMKVFNAPSQLDRHVVDFIVRAFSFVVESCVHDHYTFNNVEYSSTPSLFIYYLLFGA